MNNINKKQKIILLVIAIIITFIIGIFIMKEKNNSENIYKDYIIEEDEQKITIENDNIIVHITGEVKNSGIIEAKSESRISNIIEAAGGTTENADLSKINLAYKVEDGQKIYIPSIYDEHLEEYIINDSGDNVIIEMKSKNNLIDINNATQTELETLSGIGPSTALKIIEYRKEKGKFKKKEDIMNVEGVGESKFNNIKEQIYVK